MSIEYEGKFERGEIDPFNGWTPGKEAKKKRQKLRGKYVALHKAADQFIEERSQANQTTKDNYRRHLDMLEDQLGRTMPVTEIMEKDIREFCFRDDLAPATQASYLRHLKVFFKWMHEKEILKEDLAADIKPPKVPQKIAGKTISREGLDEVFKAFDKFYKEQKEKGYVTKPHQMRLWFKPMINTMYYCGLRASEAVNLKWSDIDLEGNPNDPEDLGQIRITNSDDNTTKSGKERVIPIKEPLKPWLVQWHKKQGEPSDGYAFPSSTGLNKYQGMSAGSLSRSFKKFVKKAEGVPNSVTLHGLRHSCATDLLRKRVPIHIVQKIMGHSSIDVTQIYEHLGRFRDQKAVSIEELYQFYKEKEPNLLRSTLRWRVYELNDKGILSRVKRGVYRLGAEVREWKPERSKELRTIDSKLRKEFPYLTFCIWSTKWLLNFTQHLPTKYFTLVDTERDTEESIFYYLQNTRKDSGVFLKPSRDEVQKYLGSSENLLVIRPLISQSPLMTVNEVQVPKLEKMMVDLVADEVLFDAFQGKELKTICSNIVDKYDVNISTLKRYAQRRNKWDGVKQYLKETNEQILS